MALDGNTDELPDLFEHDKEDIDLQSYNDVVAQALGKLKVQIEKDIQVFEGMMVTAATHRQRWQIRKTCGTVLSSNSCKRLVASRRRSQHKGQN